MKPITQAAAFLAGVLCLAAPGTGASMNFALADFRSLTVSIKDEGGGLEHLQIPLGFWCAKTAVAETDRQDHPRKYFTLGPGLTATDGRVATAHGPHTEAQADTTNWRPILPKLTFNRHTARAQGSPSPSATAVAWTKAEFYFDILGDPEAGDTITLTATFDNPTVVEIGKALAFLSVDFSGTIMEQPKYFSFKPGQEIAIPPITVDLASFGPGERVRFEVYPKTFAMVTPEPNSLALLAAGLAAIRRSR